jgi:hypothetical protein
MELTIKNADKKILIYCPLKGRSGEEKKEEIQ